ncbi:MAG: hypothetical protein QOF14_5416 [Hyphomicrobiales bacterium]|nr:hypothetical protein [Hyphomicrobiales bacterium]
MNTNAPLAAVLPSLSIAQFCAAENLSRSFFYKLKKQGRAPLMMENGRRKTISPAAREAWHRARESEAAA